MGSCGAFFCEAVRDDMGNLVRGNGSKFSLVFEVDCNLSDFAYNGGELVW